MTVPSPTATVCLWRLHGCLLDFILLSATGVAETAESTQLKGCQHTFGHLVYEVFLNGTCSILYLPEMKYLCGLLSAMKYGEPLGFQGSMVL
jgi:hypothetical protein